VRFRVNGLRFVQPTLTDGQGRFELQIPFIPTDDESGRRLYSHPLVAFHAFEPLAARQDVRLDRPETLTEVRLTRCVPNRFKINFRTSRAIFPPGNGKTCRTHLCATPPKSNSAGRVCRT
jgi:hypothetical protein